MSVTAALPFAIIQATVDPVLVTGAIGRFTDFLLRYLFALAAVGALAMATMELFKRMTDYRTRFHARAWTRWMLGSGMNHAVPGTPGAADARFAPSDARFASSEARFAPGDSQVQAYGELLQLTTGLSRDDAFAAGRALADARGRLGGLLWPHRQPAHALFALELERMMGSIQDAADVTLGSPARWGALYLLLTYGADEHDVATWWSDAEWIARAGPAADVTDEGGAQRERVLAKHRADRYARLRQVVKRRLDGFQLFTGDQWTNQNQGAANLIGILILFIVLLVVRSETPAASQPALPMLLVLSLLGGILSPVAKDLITALKRVRNG